MGYTTDFSGTISIDPPLNEAEIEFINKFAATRRVQRTRGPYYVEDTDCGVLRGPGPMNISGSDDVTNMNDPPEGQPGLWCQWNVSATEIFWDGGEKFYESPAWMKYIIEHFLQPGALAAKELPFLQANHICNGEISADGEDGDDHWLLEVRNNIVRVKQGVVHYESGGEII